MSMREKQGLGWLPMMIITVGLGAGIGLWGWTMLSVVQRSKETGIIITKLEAVSETVKEIKAATSDLVTKSEFENFSDRQQRIDERQTGRIDQLSIGLSEARRDFMERRK